MVAKTKNQNRPLSPFLQLAAKTPMTSGLSIMHRITGFALTIGLLYLLWWIIATAVGPQAYAVFAEFSGSPLGLFMIFGWTFCVYYHLANGIRHLFWDTGALFNLKYAYMAGIFVVVFALMMTGATWFFTGI